MTLDEKDIELSRLRAIIRQAIWDIEVGRPDMVLECLRMSHIDESPLPERFSK